MSKLKLHEVVAAALKIPTESVSDATSPETQRRWSSLRHLTLLNAVEDACGVRFSTADILRVQSVGDLRQLLRERGIEVD